MIYAPSSISKDSVVYSVFSIYKDNVAVNMVPMMNTTVAVQSDQIYRYRAGMLYTQKYGHSVQTYIGTLRSVDDMINYVHDTFFCCLIVN